MVMCKMEERIDWWMGGWMGGRMGGWVDVLVEESSSIDSHQSETAKSQVTVRLAAK